MKKILNKKNYMLIIKLIETVSNLYKTEDKSICLNPYTLIENKEISSNENLYRIIQDIKKVLKKIKNNDVKILNKLENNLGIVYDMLDLQKKIAKHNTSVIFPPKNRLLRKKKYALFALGYNTPYAGDIKITPLEGTSFQSYFSNRIPLDFYINWLCSSFYLASEANILIKAFNYIYNKNKGNSYSDTELNNYTIWLIKQIYTEYPNYTDLLYNKNSNINPNIYLIDFLLEDFMFREIFEDILYVLLNLILADYIVRYIENINLNSISSENFFNEISLIVDKHYLNYKDEYKLLNKLRKFTINNYVSTYTLEELYNNGCELEKKLIEKKNEEKELAEFEIFEAN